MPFARKAFEGVVARTIAPDQPLPDYKDSYQEWRRPYEQKRAGIYVISVAAAVLVAEKTLSQRHRMRTGTVSTSDMEFIDS